SYYIEFFFILIQALYRCPMATIFFVFVSYSQAVRFRLYLNLYDLSDLIFSFLDPFIIANTMQRNSYNIFVVVVVCPFVYFE
ncbi:hypothetical protein DERP_002854, partial [Dermatophagoides pteronyssinus]